MGFLQNLRMQTLFRPNRGGFGPVRKKYIDDEEEIPIEQGLTEREKVQLQLAALERNLNPALRAGAMNSNRMNVVYNEPITPFQRESLSLRDRSLDISENRNQLNAELSAERNRLSADRNRIQDDRTAIQQQRADIYKFKAENPNLRFDFSGPTIKIGNPITGEIKDTGIATGNLSDEDRIALTQENALERITLADKFRRELEEIRTTNAMKRQLNQEILDRETKALEEPKEELPSQTRVRNYNNAKYWAARVPTLLKNKHIEFTGNPYEFRINQGSLTDLEYNDLLDKIYGTKTTPLPKNEKPKVETKDPKIEQKRNQAIEILKKNNKPVTEKNIEFVMGQIK